MAYGKLPELLRITVTSAEGTATFTGRGVCIGYSVKPPSAGATFDIEFTDEDAFGVAGETGCVGNATIRDNFQLHAVGTCTLSNCSADGAWQVKLWYDE